jgi:hypothetical protein
MGCGRGCGTLHPGTPSGTSPGPAATGRPPAPPAGPP